MKINCFVLHTDSGFNKLVAQIKKRKAFSLMPIEYDIEAVSCKTFSKDFNPHLTFIHIDVLEKEYNRIYTLINKSTMVIAFGCTDILNQKHLEGVKFYLPANTDFNKFSSWTRLFETFFIMELISIPVFEGYSAKLNGLKTGQQIEVILDDIVMIKIKNGVCYVGLEDQTIICKNTFAELYSLFRHRKFVQASEEIIINLEKFKGSSYDVLHMTNGENVILGQRFKMNFCNLLLNGFIGSRTQRKHFIEIFRCIDEAYNIKERKECMSEYIEPVLFT